MELRQLSVNDGIDIYNFLQTIEENENEFTNPVKNMSYEEFQSWLIQMDDWSKNKNLPEGYVSQVIYWLYDGDLPVGIGKIRMSLTEYSRNFGGNIGYAIGNQYRGKGYGTELVKLLVEQANLLKVKEKLLTVEKSNPASKRAIEKAGGMLDHENEQRWYLVF